LQGTVGSALQYVAGYVKITSEMDKLQLHDALSYNYYCVISMSLNP